MRALKMRSTAARPLEGDDDQLRVIMEADPLTTKWEAAKGLNVNCSTVAQHLKQIEKVKYLTKWVLHELISYPKYHHFEALSSYSMQQQWTISRYNCDMWWKSRFYTTTSSDQLSGWTNEKLQSTSQSHAYIKKRVIVTVWWSAASLIYYRILNPSETITSEKYAQQISEMHQKWQRLQLA